MKKIGLTGNIGSGKSTVAAIFRNLGIPVFNADNEAKKLYTDLDIVAEVVKIYGNGILNSENEVDLKILSETVFNDKMKLEQLNLLMHTGVFSKFNEWSNAQQNVPYIIMESALIFESPVKFKFEQVIAVDSHVDICFERVKKRDGLSRVSFDKRLSFQMKREDKNMLADFVIINNDEESLIEQILAVHKKLMDEKG